MRNTILFVLSIVACGAPRERPAATVATASAATASSAPPPATASAAVVQQPPPEPARLVVFKSRDEVPEALRSAVPSSFDFRAQVLAGWLRPGNSVQVIEHPAMIDERGGVLSVVAIVHHVPAPARHCPGGIPDPRDVLPHPEAETMRLAGLLPNFLVALDRARAIRARSLDVKYAIDVDDPPAGGYVDPNAPCPPYP